MKVGKLVQKHIRQIFFYCDNVEHDEINSLLDPKFSKNTFGIQFPFCIDVRTIEDSESKRYWREVYLVRGRQVRVTSQWYIGSAQAFVNYLESKRIEVDLDQIDQDVPVQTNDAQQTHLPSKRRNSRYRGNHIGNAQNLFIRNILSSLGDESFSEEDWNATKSYFSNRCAYCGANSQLVIEHAIPINKEELGEHRIGNLVPSCEACNRLKAGRHYKEFLCERTNAIVAIEAYMNSKNYIPLESNDQMKLILNMAHKEIAALAERYITIINQLFPQK